MGKVWYHGVCEASFDISQHPFTLLCRVLYAEASDLGAFTSIDTLMFSACVRDEFLARHCHRNDIKCMALSMHHAHTYRLS